MNRTLSDTFIVCTVAVALALLTNGLRPRPLSLLPVDNSAEAAAADQDVRQISIEAAIAAFNQNSALFADARPTADYIAGHIAGALHLPASASEQWIVRLFESTDPDQTLITYCAGSKCHLGRQVAQTLEEAGFESVYYLVDGWGKWTARNLPTEKGK